MLVWFAVGAAWLCVGLVVALGLGAVARTGNEVDLESKVAWLLEENVKLRERITRADARAYLAQEAAAELRKLVTPDANLLGGRDPDRPLRAG